MEFDCRQEFQANYRINHSSRDPGTHLVNIILTQMNVRTKFEIPTIQAVELTNERKLWSIQKRDNVGKFFALTPTTEDAVSVLKIADGV